MSKLWPVVKLREVVREEREPVGTLDGSGYPVFGVTNTEGVTITGVAASDDRSKYLRLHPNRFVYNPYRINVGSLGLSSASQDGIVSPAYVVFTSTEKLDSNFLLHFLKSGKGHNLINFYGNRGTVRAALRFEDLCKIEIPLLPLAEQRRIVAKIENLSAKIEEAQRLRNQSVNESETLAHSISRTAFRDTGKFCLVQLKDVCSEIIDCLHSNPIYSEIGIPTVRSPDVGLGKLFLKTAKKTSEQEYRRRTFRGEPKPGDIILVREGGGTGKAGIVEEGQQLSLGQRVMQLRPNKEKVLSRFLLRQWLSPLIQEDQIGEMMKGSASPHLNIGSLKKFTFILPPIEEQRRIVVYLDSLEAKVDGLKQLQAQTAAELDALLPSILDKAFKGKL